MLVESIANKLGQPILQVRTDIDIEAKRLHSSKIDVARRVNRDLASPKKPAEKPAEKLVEKPAATPAPPAPAKPAEKPAPPPKQEMTPDEIEAILDAEQESQSTDLVDPGSVTVIADITDARRMRDTLDAIKVGVLKKSNTATIQGKIWINRSGWRVIAGAMNVSNKIVSQTRTVDEKGIITWAFIVETSMPNGRVATGVGMCKSNEKGGKDEHAVFATAHTRALNRAISDIVGAGEVSADEIGE